MNIFKISSILALLFNLMMACNTKNKDDHSLHKKKPAFYTCSMDPQVKEDRPGKCPICHMELNPVNTDETEANEIGLSQQQITLGNVTTQYIEETTIHMDQTYNGVLSLNQERVRTVSSRAMGRIVRLFYKTVGDFVKQGSPAYELYSEDIAIVKQDYIAAFKQISIPGEFGNRAHSLLNIAQDKLVFYGLNNTQIEALKTNQVVSPYTIFYSPYSGTIAEVMAVEGSYVMEGSELLQLGDLNSLWLETQVNANYATNLRIGQIASVSFAEYPEQIINSRITFINPEINADSRLLLVRLEIPNAGMQLKPGMQGIAKIKEGKMKGFYIPTNAVIREQKASYIWVEKKPGVFENLMVETGRELNGMIEIKTKINASKKVVITGAYAINSEYKFRKGSNPMEGMKM